MVAIMTPEPQSRARLLHAASVAMRLGIEPVAGIVARILLERHLKRLCASHDCKPERKYTGTEQYIDRLYNKKYMSKPTYKELKFALKICNRCAHGDPEAWHEVEAAVDSISAFLTSHPLPPAIG